MAGQQSAYSRVFYLLVPAVLGYGLVFSSNGMARSAPSYIGQSSFEGVFLDAVGYSGRALEKRPRKRAKRCWLERQTRRSERRSCFNHPAVRLAGLELYLTNKNDTNI